MWQKNMLTKVTLSVHKVPLGDVIAEDLFIDYRLLAKQDLVLTERIIEVLKLRKVDEITVDLSQNSNRIVSNLSSQRIKDFEDVFEPLFEKKELDRHQENASIIQDMVRRMHLPFYIVIVTCIMKNSCINL